MPALSTDEAPVLMTVIWLNAVEAAVLVIVSWLVTVEIAVEIDAIADFTDDMPAVAVDSEPEKISQVLFSVETFAWVLVAVVVDWLDDRVVPTEVTDDKRALSEVVCDNAEDMAVDSEAA